MKLARQMFKRRAGHNASPSGAIHRNVARGFPQAHPSNPSGWQYGELDGNFAAFQYRWTPYVRNQRGPVASHSSDYFVQVWAEIRTLRVRKNLEHSMRFVFRAV